MPLSANTLRKLLYQNAIAKTMQRLAFSLWLIAGEMDNKSMELSIFTQNIRLFLRGLSKWNQIKMSLHNAFQSQN